MLGKEGGEDSSTLGCSLSKRQGPQRAWPPASTEEARARPQIRSRIFPFNDLLYGLVFLGVVFFLLFGNGGGSVFIVPGWAGEQLVSIRCQLGWRLCQGRRGGDTATAFVCVSEGMAVPGARGQGHGEGGCHRATGQGGTRPLPSRLGGRAGGAPSCSDLSRTTHAEPGRVVGHSDGGVPSTAATPRGRILLHHAGISTEHGHGRSRTSANMEWGGSPPKN